MDVKYELSIKQVERNVLEAELDAEELKESEEYHELVQRIEVLRVQLNAETSPFRFNEPDAETPDP